MQQKAIDYIMTLSDEVYRVNTIFTIYSLCMSLEL